MKDTTTSFMDYMKGFLDDHVMTIGAVARRVYQEKQKGHTINTLSDLILWVQDTGCKLTRIEDSWITENGLLRIWKGYCAACNRPL